VTNRLVTALLALATSCAAHVAPTDAAPLGDDPGLDAREASGADAGAPDAAAPPLDAGPALCSGELCPSSRICCPRAHITNCGTPQMSRCRTDPQCVGPLWCDLSDI